MKKEDRQTRLLRLWKTRQEKEGQDVSGVNTLEEAKHFYDPKPEGKETAPKPGKKPKKTGKPQKDGV